MEKPILEKPLDSFQELGVVHLHRNQVYPGRQAGRQPGRHTHNQPAQPRRPLARCKQLSSHIFYVDDDDDDY